MRTFLRVTIVLAALLLLLPFVKKIPNVPPDSVETYTTPSGEKETAFETHQRYSLRPGFCWVGGGELLALSGWWYWRKRRPNNS
jgi:hypothetical protein